MGMGDSTLVEAMARAAATWPDRVALQMGAETLSYRTLHQRADALALHLCESGVGAQSLVAVAMERSFELVVALLAIWKSGGAYVPLDPDYPPDRLAFMLEDSAAEVVLTQHALRSRLPNLRGAVVEVDLFGGTPAGRIGPGPTMGDLAYVIYTSGSTGRPKGAMLEHRSIANRIAWMQNAFPLGEDDVVLQKTPTSFDVSVWELFWSQCVGARMELAKPGGHRDDLYLAELIAGRGVTTCHFVPSMLVAFLEAPNVQRCADSLRRVICSGEALPVDVVRRFRDRLPGVELHNLYGPTEAAVDVSHWAVDFDSDIVPIGKAISGVTLDIVDPESRVRTDREGELWIGGVQVGRGYLNRPGLSAERFIDDPFRAGERIYRTGDRVRRLPSGDIEFLGRFDHQVKVRGFRIELGEIEARLLERDSALSALPGVREAVATVQGEAQSARLLGYLVTDGPLDTQALRAELSARLPAYMVPGLVRIDDLPRTPNGKVDRDRLPHPDSLGRATSTEYVAPRDATEEVVAGIWGQVLKVEKVGVEDDFFELGGTSLVVTQVIARVRQAFRIDVSLRVLFDHPRVASLVQALRESHGERVDQIAPLLLELARANVDEAAEVVAAHGPE